MAGGFGRRDGPTLAERSRGSTPGPPEATSPVVPPPGADDPPRAPAEAARVRPVGQRHCWVVGLPGAPSRCAGVVVAWRALPGEDWCARTVYVVSGHTDYDIVVDAWVPARYLRPT